MAAAGAVPSLLTLVRCTINFSFFASFVDLAEIVVKMSNVTHKVLVLSGKGGVGKSTVSAQLAFYLASKGYNVGLLDLDICGPSIPRMLGIEGESIHASASGWSPVHVKVCTNRFVRGTGSFRLCSTRTILL